MLALGQAHNVIRNMLDLHAFDTDALLQLSPGIALCIQERCTGLSERHAKYTDALLQLYGWMFGGVAIVDASSVAGLLTTSEAMIVDKPQEGGAPAMPPGGGMGGMPGMM